MARQNIPLESILNGLHLGTESGPQHECVQRYSKKKEKWRPGLPSPYKKYSRFWPAASQSVKQMVCMQSNRGSTDFLSACNYDTYWAIARPPLRISQVQVNRGTHRTLGSVSSTGMFYLTIMLCIFILQLRSRVKGGTLLETTEI